MLTIAWRAMGAQMQAWLERDTPQASAVLRRVPDWFETWEARLSRFRGESELSQLNARPGAWSPVSPVFWEVLDAALRAARLTDGLVSPLVLPALVQAGYDRSFETLTESAGWVDVAPQPCPEWRTLERRPGTHSVYLPHGAGLDFGGVAKGWAADRAVRKLRAFGPTLVDAGGDIAVSGPPEGQPGWRIDVADPALPERSLLALRLRRGGVATSGRDYRHWTRAGRERHHLIDPRTGLPADSDVIAVTAIGPSAVDAEAAAKAVLILGREAGLAWLDARPHLAGVIVTDDGRVSLSDRMTPYVVSASASG